MTVLGIAGSLRNASYNKLLLNAAVKLAPDGTTIGATADLVRQQLTAFKKHIEIAQQVRTLRRT